jgi:ubiquinone/menaquinone biosynthesis C-methylase UbiE
MDPYAGFAAIYDEWYPMTGDVDFYADLARESHGPVVELAVGTGRVAIPVAVTTGRRVIGIDASESMLARAAERAQAAGVELDLRLCDLRDLALDEPAALVYCPARSLLHLPTSADRRRVFERVTASLRPGGRFAWNAFVFDRELAASIDGAWRDENGVRNRVDYDYAERRATITLESGSAISLWWVTRSEWDDLIEVAGLELEALYGGFDRSPFDDTSREFVYVARKPE